MANFHSLKVTELKRETPESVSILFEVPLNLATTFSFTQGQYLTLKTQIEGAEVRRSYSICSSPSSGELRVAVKQIPSGTFSTYANTQLALGDVLDVMPPMGSFYTPLSAHQTKQYVAFASGSGSTPIMSILRATLETEVNSTFTFFYGNKTSQSTLFKSELEALQNSYPKRLQVHFVYSREQVDTPMFSGRLSAEKCQSYHKELIDFTKVDEVFLCGPEALVFELKDTLKAIGLPEKKIHFELFTAAKPIKTKEVSSSDAAPVVSQVEVIVDGESYALELAENGETILDAAMAVDADVPFACKGGVCCACKAKVMEGSVKMDVNYALDEEEVAEGYVLTCQSHPTSAKLVIDFDEI